MNTSKGILSKASKIIAIVFAVFVVFLCIVIATLQAQKPQDLEILNVDMTTIKDGVYIGNADNGLVKVTVSVEVSNGILQDISILKHDNLLGKPAETIIDIIIAQQSLEVDAITSATYSSDTIRKAVENALRQGE